MNLAGTQIKDTYGNLLTIGSVAGTPTTGTLQNGAGSNITELTINGGATDCPIKVESTDAGAGIAFKDNTTADFDQVGVGALGDGLCLRAGGNINTTISSASLLTHNGAAVFNESGADVDFRVEGDTDANLLFVDASADRVGIGTNTPSVKLQVVGSAEFGVSTATDYTTRISGYGTTSGGSRFGSYGNLILNSNTNATGTARRFLLTNALDNNKFAIIRSTDASTDPSLGDAGVVSSGTADFVINNTGNVGVNTTTPAAKLEVADTTSAFINLRRTDSTSGNGAIRSIGNTGTINAAINIGGGVNNNIVFTIGAGEVARFDSNGLKFNGDTAAANALDDYEEGTWTATLISGATTTPTSTSVGYYTKVGRVVHVMLTSTFGSITVNGTAIAISGLPFTSGYTNAVGHIGVTARAQYQSSATHCWQIESSTQLHAVYMSANSGSPVDLLSEASGTYTPTFYVNITYTV